ncbi:hypothetical protein INR49_010594, partial [Caranx melampygus]
HLQTGETTVQLRVTAANTDEEMVSIKATVMVVTLLTVCLLVTNTSAVRRGCCPGYATRKVPFDQIQGYSIQVATEMCPFNAIIFHTNTKLVCTNPALKWVIDYVNYIRNRAQQIHNRSTKRQG